MQNNKIYLSFDMSGNFLCRQEDDVKIYSGSVASVEYIIVFNENLSPNDYVYISFTRPDNKKTSPLLCERVLDNTFRHLSTGEELDCELDTVETMLVNVSVKGRDILTNISAIKTQASVELSVYPGSQFVPGIIDEGLTRNFEEHLISVERDTVKRYNMDELDSLVIPFEVDGYKQAPAVYIGYEHKVNYINYNDLANKSKDVKGNLLVFSELIDNCIMQSEYIFINNNIFARTLKINSTNHDVIDLAEFKDITGGADGKSTYIKYAKDQYGSDAKDVWEDGFDFIGVYIGYEQSENVNEYRWARFTGKKGGKGDRGDIGLTGATGKTGEKGEQGNGISSVTFVKVLDNGNWQYSINFTDGTNTLFETPRGPEGKQGNDGLNGKTGATGQKGDKGDNGNDFTINGYVSSSASLPQNLTSKDVGTAYLVGTTTPRRVWLWGYNEDKELVWSDQGYLQGPKGDTGDTGQTGQTGATGANGQDGTGIAGFEHKCFDENGNNIYTLSLTDGRTFDLLIPKGTDGAAGSIVKSNGEILWEFNADDKANASEITSLSNAVAELEDDGIESFSSTMYQHNNSSDYLYSMQFNIYKRNSAPIAGPTLRMSKNFAFISAGSYFELAETISGKRTFSDGIDVLGEGISSNKIKATDMIELKGQDLSRSMRNLIPSGTTILTNANLNSVDYIKVGSYYCFENATVATLTNSPTNNSFIMEVFTPLATTIDDEESRDLVYRLRHIITFTGQEYWQEVHSLTTIGTFTYGDWYQTCKKGDDSSIPSNLKRFAIPETITIGQNQLANTAQYADNDLMVSIWLDSDVNGQLSDVSGISFLLSTDGSTFHQVARSSSTNGYPKFEGLTYVVPKGYYYKWNYWGTKNNFVYAVVKLS